MYTHHTTFCSIAITVMYATQYILCSRVEDKENVPRERDVRAPHQFPFFLGLGCIQTKIHV